MAISKEKKSEILKKLKQSIADSMSLVFVNFKGLTVAEVSKIRRDLRSKGVGYTVAKKTLVKRAITEGKFEGEIPQLDGELALAYGKDPIEPARTIFAYQKEYKGHIHIMGGMFEGKILDASAMTEIATIPSMQVLRGQFVNLINSPIQRFVVALNQIAESRQ